MITIGAVSRQTGITAATLRKWETRYGFPVPVRTAGAHRAFHAAELDALLDVSRRMAMGQRAGLAIRAVKSGFAKAGPDTSTSATLYTPEVSHALALLLQNDLQSFEDCLGAHLSQRGAAMFAHEIALPLIDAVGNLWQRDRLRAYAEHLFSSILQKVVLGAVVHPAEKMTPAPQVLLASPAGEAHTLALILLNSVLREAGIGSVFLQGGLPAAEIAAAAAAFKVRVVALSASVACPPRLLATELRCLRALLDARMELWVGGAGMHRVSTRMEGVTVMPSIDAAVKTLQKKVGRDPNIALFRRGKNRD